MIIASHKGYANAMAPYASPIGIKGTNDSAISSKKLTIPFPILGVCSHSIIVDSIRSSFVFIFTILLIITKKYCIMEASKWNLTFVYFLKLGPRSKSNKTCKTVLRSTF